MENLEVDQKYIDFIDKLTEQISDLLPEDINKLQEDYLKNNVKHSAILLASSLQSEEVFSKLDFEQHQNLIQIMAEWSFHKEIDLFRSGISAKYWKVVMQKIWYTMWEVMYACAKSDADETVTLSLVERYVNRTYNEAIEELKNSNIIDEKIEEQAKEQSNINIMVNQYRKKLFIKKIFRIFYYIILFILISLIVSFLVLKYNTKGIIGIMIFLVIYNIMPFRK